MKKIELSSEELRVLHDLVDEKFNPFLCSDSERDIASAVLDKADDLMAELDAYDELGDSLVAWFLGKYEMQEALGKEG